MKLIIFEDAQFDWLYPLTYMRPAFELVCGATTLADKIRHAAHADSVAYFVRDWLAEYYAEQAATGDAPGPVNDPASLDGDVILVNGRLLVDGKCDIAAVDADEALMTGETLVAARVKAATLAAARRTTLADTLAALLPRLRTTQAKPTMINYPWLLIRHQGEMLKKDFVRRGRWGIHAPMHPLSCLCGHESNVFIAESAKISPMVVIDVTGGPVTIEDGVKVLPHTRIDGPCYIGRKTQIVGGKIRHNCYFGPECRIGGEVECAIIQGYSNKYHDGFLGHSYVCEWVNLGAMTTNSDLKNDYTTVSVQFRGELTDTGEQFLGSMIGDHTKTSIGTILNTGSVIGMMSNLVSNGDLMPKSVPSFCWYLNGRPTRGMGLAKMIETARAAMARRGQTPSPACIRLIEHLHSMLSDELRKAIKGAFGR